MKKLFPIAFLLLTTPAWATTYYACSNPTLSGASAFNAAQTCDGTAYTYGTGGFPENGATLDANGQTVTIDTNPGPNGTVTLVNSNAAGSFAVATSVTPLTLNCNIGASSGGSAGVGLSITGNANASPALTIGAVGTPVNIYGGNAASIYGVNDAHTVGTVVIYATSTGGTNTSAYGYYLSGTGPATVVGNGVGVNAVGYRFSSSGTVTMTGNCIGSDTANNAVGCSNVSTGAFTLTGSIINGARDVGASGAVRFTPGTYGSTKYVKFNGGGTAIYLSLPPAEAGILTTSNYINKDDGTADPGTASAGGVNFIQ